MAADPLPDCSYDEPQIMSHFVDSCPLTSVDVETALPHYCADPDVTWGMVGGAPSCALLGGFAIGVRLSFAMTT